MDQKEFEKQYMGMLNEQQKEAVYAVDGAVLLLATPGSGKTTVLVTRLGYMILSKGIDPKSILTMTYTVAATRDMKSRYAAFFGNETATGLEFRTINGVAKRIIDYFGQNHAGKEPFDLATEEGELNRIVRYIYQEVNENYPEDGEIKEIRRLFTYIKNMMLTEKEIQTIDSNVDNLPEIYRRYRTALRQRRLMDFDDQLSYAYHILQQYPAVLDHFQKRYPYICVDEAQDTSKIQHAIIKLLSSKHGNLFMVGDEDQSIYGFRAAYPDALLSFEKDHPNAKILLIEENYRSTEEIITAADRFIAENKFRHKKTMIPTQGLGSPIHVIRTKSRFHQFEYLVNMAKNCTCETAILFRNNDTALPLIDRMERDHISYNCKNFDDVFFSNRVVVDVMDIIQLAYDPWNVELFQRLYYKFGAAISKKSAQYAVDRCNTSKKPLFEELMHAPDVKGAAKDTVIDLADNMPRLKEDNAEAAITRIWEKMHYGKYVEQKKLDAGKRFILGMLARGIDNPQLFLEKLQTLRETIAEHRNQEGNRIILSTVHSSKGLEYDAVYMADVIDGILPSIIRPEAKTDEELKQYEEERRLFYVGITRAKKDLFLFQCGESSEFISEVANALPVPVTDKFDILSPLTGSQIGKHYYDRAYGKGEVVAECDGSYMVSFSNRHYELMSIVEMMLRKETKANSIGSKDNLHFPSDRDGAENDKLTPICSVSQLRVGANIYHKKFGKGTIRTISERSDTLIVAFEKKGVKTLGLSMSLKKKLLTT